ncbi:MAG TPA: transglutaminase domain-containing protein, partial [Hanamia sp.]|nr:transglutaminase domain-containing protein [Hanamia sp.]
KAVLGSYGKKTSANQLKLIDQLIADQKAPGTLVAAGNYQKGMHCLFSADFEKAQTYYNEVGNIKNWQYAGPFENLSESGFYKDYGPLEHPEPTAVFKSVTNADVKWFTPPVEAKDGWTPVIYQFNKNTAVIYAQNFVTSPTDQTVYCNVGFSGSIKVWINDELVISEAKPRVTEMDNSTVKYDLKKGVNRVLVQLGYADISYPNFTVRFTDEKYKAIANITGSSAFSPYPKNTGSNKKYELIPNFAEKYFTQKIKNEPQNLLNYLLLADVYLRNQKLLEARDLISGALKNAPENSLLRVKLLEILNKQNNRTLFLEELEKVKQADPESVLVLDLRIKELYDNEKYDDCAAELANSIKLHGEDEFTGRYQILLLIHDKKYDELVNVAEKMYDKYPDNKDILSIMYNIKKEVYKDNKGAQKIYENYMKHSYDYDTYIKYADILIEQGNAKKGIEIKEKLSKLFPYAPVGFYNLSKYYYSTKEYDKAEEYIRKSLALSPYNENYWEQLGDIKNEKKDVAAALDSYNQSLKFDPNQYDIISKIRKLNNKPDIYKLFPMVDIDKAIKEDNPEEAKNTDYGYYYILDQKDVVMYSDGATEEYVSLIVKITNDKGVDQFKESNIGYNNSQTLLIEKAEIIKKNQSKIEGERNDNQIVFTNLQAGDIVVFKYRIQNYTYGRFAKDFWDRYYFGGKIYSSVTKYNLLVPAGQKINYLFSNSNVQPVKTNVEDFNQYCWVISKPEPLKDEPLMPLSTDEGTVLHVSTVSSWKEIANWYSDVCNNKSEIDYEISALYKKLFPDENKKMSEFEKAKIIYEYIESNIRYSSVSFRQSAYVPQRASTTLNTRLGDCKDLSNLFVMLARMAGIKAQMVLIDTRDNGQKDILLPSVEFNHCIAKVVLDNKSYYIELTDNYLPFTSLPNNLNGALALEIPLKSTNENAELIHLKPANRTKDIIKRVINILPDNDDLTINVKTVKYGAFSSPMRESYQNLDNEKQLQDMQKTIAGSYKNNVRLDKLSFSELDKLTDSVQYNYHYKVQNEVAEIGSLFTFKVVYPDIVATLDNFSSDKRVYPIEYWNYENADSYETTVNITAPAGKRFVELPKNETLSFKDLKYSIQYTLKADDKLVITRKFSDARGQQISPEDYPVFKSFFEKIVKAEQKFIAYK